MTLLRFRTAGVRIDLHCYDQALSTLVERVGAPMLTKSAAPEAEVHIEAAHIEVPPGADLEQRAARVLSAVDRAALAASPSLPIHAAALAGPHGCVLLPGESGRGKTTLAAAAMQIGLTLVSDEAACLIEPVGQVLPHPRPLGLSLESRAVLGVAHKDEPDCELACAPDLFGRSADPGQQFTCVAIVLPRRSEGAQASLVEIRRGTALTALLDGRLDSSRGRSPWPHERAWRYLTELTARAAVHELSYDDPRDGAWLLSMLLT